MTYDGPYRVISRTGKTFDISVKGKVITVSIDRLKPANVINDNSETQEGANQQPVNDMPEHGRDKPRHEPTSSSNQTRTGRRVRFPDRLQGGFA